MGGRGHEGTGGKWQLLGLRPQLMVLVQPHPGGESWLQHISRRGEGRDKEKSPSVECVPPQYSFAASLWCPQEGWRLACQHPASPQDPGFQGLGNNVQLRLLCAPRRRGRALVEGRRARFWRERLV